MLTPYQRPSVRPAHDSPGLSVLVVDANSDAADSLADLLSIYGHDVRTAYDPEAALAAGPTDVVILEPRMPGADGWEMVRRMRTRPAEKQPLYLAVTTCSSKEDRVRSAQVGIGLHLVKPVDPAVLVGVLKRFAQALSPGHPPSPNGRARYAGAGVVPRVLANGTLSGVDPGDSCIYK